MKYLLLLSVLALSACTGTTSKPAEKSNVSQIMHLIAKTEEVAPVGVKSSIRLPIKASGWQSKILYLNTQEDYRDRRNITIAIHPSIINALTDKYGASPDLFFLNKQILVSGIAKRVKIDFYSQGRKTKKYYFQTHIRVSSIDQIKVLSELNNESG